MMKMHMNKWIKQCKYARYQFRLESRVVNFKHAYPGLTKSFQVDLYQKKISGKELCIG